MFLHLIYFEDFPRMFKEFLYMFGNSASHSCRQLSQLSITAYLLDSKALSINTRGMMSRQTQLSTVPLVSPAELTYLPHHMSHGNLPTTEAGRQRSGASLSCSESH